MKAQPLQQTAFEKIEGAALALLKSLVEVNSHTLNPAGVEQNAAIIEQAFLLLGFRSQRLPAATPGAASHLFLESRGDGPVILLVSHMDTVYLAQEQANLLSAWKEERARIIGPGVFDNKGGTVMIWMLMHVMQDLYPAMFESCHWILAFNSAEEALDAGFSECCARVAGDDVRAALVFEGDSGLDDSFQLVSRRHGISRFDLSIFGHGAHAGNGHERGASAIRQLALIVNGLEELTDYSEDITVNVGTVHGGQSPGRVPDFAEARFEVRFPTGDKGIELEKRIQAVCAGDLVRSSDGSAVCRIAIRRLFSVAPFDSRSAATEVLFQQAADDLGVPLAFSQRRGVSDANFLSKRFPVVMDGLGVLGGNAHGIEITHDGRPMISEFIDKQHLVSKAVFNLTALVLLAR